MLLTEERATILMNYFGEDEDRTQMLLAMSVEEAVDEINADGYDFTIEELKEFSAMAERVSVMKSENGGFAEEDLSEVTGGSAWSWVKWVWDCPAWPWNW